MDNSKRRLTLVTTGGTIEKTYDEKEGTLENRETFIKSKLEQKLRLPYMDLEVKALMHKDSLYMDDHDRKAIFECIRDYEARGNPIVVLHGTDTMALSAKYCFEKMKSKVPVVFTGAMKPLGFEDSDAIQNVTEALMAAFIVKPGFYISFHNRLFEVPKVEKNKATSTFSACF